MSPHRALALTLAAFAVSFAALGVGGATAWVRCGRDSGCSGDLALGVAAAAPAALLASVVTLLLRRRASSPMASRVLLAGAAGLAAVPLAVFVIRDLVTLAVMGALWAALVYLTLIEDAEVQTGSAEDMGVAGASGVPEVDGIGDVGADRPPSSLLARADRAGSLRSVESLTVSLCVLGVRDFEQLAAIYTALAAHPDTTSVVVRRFVGAFASLEIGVASAASWASVEDLLSSTANETPGRGLAERLTTGASPALSPQSDESWGDAGEHDEPRQILVWRPRR